MYIVGSTENTCHWSVNKCIGYITSHRAPISTLWPEATAKFDKANEELNVYNFYIPLFGLAWGLKGVCPGPAILRTVLQPTWGLITMGGYPWPLGVAISQQG
jgi:hypothetical protein